MLGVLTVCGIETAMFDPDDQLESMLVSLAHRARTLTVKVPALDQECETLVALAQGERVPSPQSNQ